TSLTGPAFGSSQAPNRERVFNIELCAAQGGLVYRRRFTNSTGAPVTILRFRVVDITTLDSPGYTPGGAQADLRVRDSMDESLFVPGRGMVAVQGTVREQPPVQSEPVCGGLNTSLIDNDITPASPLDVGASVDVVFHVGVQQGGNFRFFINVEATTNPAVPPKSNGSKLRAPTSKLHH